MGAATRTGKWAGQQIGLLDAAGQSTIAKSLDPTNSLALPGVSYGLAGANPSRQSWFADPMKKAEGLRDAALAPAPDVTDQMIRAVQRSESLRLKTGTTRASQFKPSKAGGY